MSSATLATPSISRPKIHRLPASVPAPVPHVPEKAPLIPGFFAFWFIMIAGLAALLVSLNRETIIVAAKSIPAVAVISDKLPNDKALAPEAVPAPAPAVKAPAPSADTSLLISPGIGDAQAATNMPIMASLQPDRSAKVISLTDNSGGIVGQMVKIPAENEQITEIKALRDIDNDAGRELLSIISKY